MIELDFLRGAAVLGILLLNVVGFAWPEVVYISPRAPGGPSGPADDAVWTTIFVLADGKFRGLFSLLFGASLLLFVTRADAADVDGAALQRRRLGWLVLFGLLHFFLLWWGDILFLYAVCGLFVLGAARWPVERLVVTAAMVYAGGALVLGALTAIPAAPWLGFDLALTDQAPSLEQAYAAEAAEEARVHRGSWSDKVAHAVVENWHAPLVTVALTGFETVPLMLLGMAAFKAGMFAGWPAARLRRWALGGTAIGLALTLPIAAWLWAEGFPLALVLFALLGPAPFGRLAMIAGYVAVLTLAARRLSSSALGERLVAAGRMAFSNYIATSLVMAAIFHGWGLGLYGRFDRLELLGFVVLGWALMLGWSKPWLVHFRHGPLEWIWRSLTYGELQPMLRQRSVAIASDSH